jgi:hypothetical protein
MDNTTPIATPLVAMSGADRSPKWKRCRRISPPSYGGRTGEISARPAKIANEPTGASSWIIRSPVLSMSSSPSGVALTAERSASGEPYSPQSSVLSPQCSVLSPQLLSRQSLSCRSSAARLGRTRAGASAALRPAPIFSSNFSTSNFRLPQDPLCTDVADEEAAATAVRAALPASRMSCFFILL